MRKAAILWVLLFLLPLVAAAPPSPLLVSDIQLPVVTVPVPSPPPLPKSAWIKLPPDVFYVIQGSSDFLVTTSPDSGLVTITREEGPVRIRGRFVEDPSKVISKTFKSKYIIVVEAVSAGRCELLVFPKSGISSLAQVQRQSLDVGGTTPPVPPLPPVPPVPPTPDPSPAPIPVSGFRVMIVYETSEVGKYPAAQFNAIYGKQVRDFLNSKTTTAEAPLKGYWILDKDTDISSLAKHWQDAMKRPRTTLPWVIISNGTSGFEGPVPAKSEELMMLLTKYGG